jgi:hypothetical protein
MDLFKPPTTEVELEGTYIVRNDITNRYVYLSVSQHFEDFISFSDHNKIITFLESIQLLGIHKELVKRNDVYSTAFLDA